MFWILAGGTLVSLLLFVLFVNRQESDFARMEADLKDWSKFGQAIKGDRK